MHTRRRPGSRIPSPLLDNIRVMVIVWRLRGNIIRTAVCWIVWHNVHSQQHTYMSSSYRSSRLGLSHWDPYSMRRGGHIELCYCNMVEWFWLDSNLILTTNWFPSVLRYWGLVIWPVNIVREMTCNVLSGTTTAQKVGIVSWSSHWHVGSLAVSVVLPELFIITFIIINALTKMTLSPNTMRHFTQLEWNFNTKELAVRKQRRCFPFSRTAKFLPSCNVQTFVCP